MIAKTYISSNLRRLNTLYRRAKTPHEALFHSKLATLELCGWIETSMDDIVIRAANRILENPADLLYYKSNTVKRVYGFKYEQHFRPLVTHLIGLKGINEVERIANPVIFNPMVGALSTLKPVRDKHAHGYIKGTTLRIDAPSTIITKFKIIYEGLLEFDSLLKAI
jgi:hypothetical protein